MPRGEHYMDVLAAMSRAANRAPRTPTTTAIYTPAGTIEPMRALLQILESLRPVRLEQSRQRAIGEQPPRGLAFRAVVAFVFRVDDALHRRAAHRTRLLVFAVHRHLVVERGDFCRKAL